MISTVCWVIHHSGMKFLHPNCKHSVFTPEACWWPHVVRMCQLTHSTRGTVQLSQYCATQKRSWISILYWKDHRMSVCCSSVCLLQWKYFKFFLFIRKRLDKIFQSIISKFSNKDESVLPWSTEHELASMTLDLKPSISTYGYLSSRIDFEISFSL